MATIRTPAKKQGADNSPEPTPNQSLLPNTNVRKSIGEWETGQIMEICDSDRHSHAHSPTKTAQGKASATTKRGPAGRAVEAREWHEYGKQNIEKTRNMKANFKNGALLAINNLYRIIVEVMEGMEKGKESNTNSVAGKGGQSGGEATAAALSDSSVERRLTKRDWGRGARKDQEDGECQGRMGYD
ncbi:hypothetical protein ACJJTC_019465 [Scirpophaga incertulas]